MHYRTDSTVPYLHLHNGNDFQPRLHIRSHKLSFKFRLVPDCGGGDADCSAIHSKLGIDFSQKLRIRAYLGFGPDVAFCPSMRPCDTWEGVQASGLSESVGAARGVQPEGLCRHGHDAYDSVCVCTWAIRASKSSQILGRYMDARM